MGKKAGTKRPATKLDKAIAQARAEVERRKKQLADANRALAQLESRRPSSDAIAPKPAVAAPPAAKPAAARKPAAAKPPVKKVATRKPPVTRATGTARRTARTARTASGPTKTP